jgi:hypothetical protein
LNRDQAKQVLLLYRPGTADAEDPEVVAAMATARQDAELGAWFSEHVRFQQAMRAKVRAIEVPSHLKLEMLAGSKKIIRPPWWTRPATFWVSAAAAACVLLAALTMLPMRSVGSKQFAAFKDRMVSEVQRQYAMDWETSDMAQLRQSIASRGGRADYDVPKGLANLKLTGGGVLRWQSNPVSMVCFDRGGGKMLFLFVMKKEAVKDPPSAATPQVGLIHDYLTASWTRGDNTYVLAGSPEQDPQTFVKKYLD